jgi:hypothetical protein
MITTTIVTTINIPVLTPALNMPPTISQEGTKISMRKKDMILNRVGFFILIGIRGLTYKGRGLISHLSYINFGICYTILRR